ncbi:hypothetical protein RN001_016300 [Aquatica leii]|uniref:HTH psq-type domain-containing protein n=1 Tax=Aquatica leii TaxID=1421715 RepID=A0AAN7S629_9COLE|nr:hypothetical protein RN001_016300 [Aquatica leii]
MSYRNAAHKYEVPKSTLEFKVKNPDHKDTCGPSPIFLLTEESELTREGIPEEFMTLYKMWNYFYKPVSLLNENKDDVGMSEVTVPSEHQSQNESKIKVIPNIVLKQANTDYSYSLPSTSESIGVFLEEPEKPARKNKRDIERVSFAVTTRNYQESFERKRALKLEEENKKLERKRKKEENAAAKALKKTARISDNNNLCIICKVRSI